MCVTDLFALVAKLEPTSWDLFFKRFQAVGPTLAALLILIGAGVTVWQKNRTDRRTLWWTRVEWAANKAIDKRPGTRNIGAAALAALASQDVKDKEDRDLLAAIADDELEDVAGKLDPADDSAGSVEFELDEVEDP